MSVAAETDVPGTFSRHLSIGAEIVPEGGVHFRVWAPDPKNLEVILKGIARVQRDLEMERWRTPCSSHRTRTPAITYSDGQLKMADARCTVLRG